METADSADVAFADQGASPSTRDSGRSDRRATLRAPPLADLDQSVLALRAEVESTGEDTLALWKSAMQNEHFLPAAANLANYLTLRHHDLSDLQPCLTAYGLSSLGRSEARVLAALDALIFTLGRASGLAMAEYPLPLLVTDGERALRREKDPITGRAPWRAATGIMVIPATVPAPGRQRVRGLLNT